MNATISTLTKTTIVVTSLTLASSVLARPEGGGERGKRGAPPEAIEACTDKVLDQACEFNGRRGSVSGICFAPTEDSSELACKPEGHDERSQDNSG